MTRNEQIDEAFATNYYLSAEYVEGECEECRNRRLSDREHAAIRARWMRRFADRIKSSD